MKYDWDAHFARIEESEWERKKPIIERFIEADNNSGDEGFFKRYLDHPFPDDLFNHYVKPAIVEMRAYTFASAAVALSFKDGAWVTSIGDTDIDVWAIDKSLDDELSSISGEYTEGAVDDLISILRRHADRLETEVAAKANLASQRPSAAVPQDRAPGPELDQPA